MQSNTLQQTVSNILGQRVTAKRAQLFANEEYGVLAAYIRAEVVREILEYRRQSKEAVEFKDRQKIFYYKDKEYHRKKK